MSVKIAYKGVEIESIDTPQIFDPPKRMVTWCYHNGEYCDVKEQDVVAILPPLPGHVSVLCHNAVTVRWAAYCAEIPVVPKPRRATNRELARWLAQGNGQVSYFDEYGTGQVSTSWTYISGDLASPADEVDNEGPSIRKWDDTEWHEPTVDYMGIEG